MGNIMNFVFDLFRVDLWMIDSFFQVSVGAFIGMDNRERSLFCFWYRRGDVVCIDLLWFHVCRVYLNAK